MQAFDENFKFSKVYFFNAPDTKFLRKQDFNKVHLFDAASNPITDKAFLEKGYLIATFGKSYAEKIIASDGENTSMIGGSGQNSPALVIMNENFVPLDKPFPHRIIAPYDLTPEQKNEIISELDSQFTAFYYKSLRKRFQVISED